MSTVCVVGMGYIGLPVAAMLASCGHEVVGYDISQHVVDTINEGRCHFFEPDLDMLLSAAVSTGRLRAASSPARADYYVIAVPTPIRDDKTPDLSYVDAAAEAIAPFLTPGATVILESTSPVGATERMTKDMAALRSDLTFPRYRGSARAQVFVAHCPERILPGQMVRELTSNDRIVGGMTPACAASAKALYETFVTAECFVTDCRTAELVKLVENSYRDVNIAFANELSLICDKMGVDVWSAISLANHHPRVNILQPGAGVGGHCIAVDPWFIVDGAPEAARLIRTAREVNDAKPHHVIDRIKGHAGRFKQPVVACYGITYKPDVEDLRESPAIEIVEALAASDDLRVLVCEPQLAKLPPSLSRRRNVQLVDIPTAVAQADIAAFLVGHAPFKELEPDDFLDTVVVDAIGLFAGREAGSQRPRPVAAVA